ncbi:DASH family cryptochrome [Nemania sp. FL0916]|nr:DASH family cryptochrome [Nemania sp. FL0916]
MQDANVLIYVVRHDLRVADNPILDHLASSPDHKFTHLLPVHIIPPNQIEVSGFLQDGKKSPFPEARSETARFWRCGPHRARFIAQSLWNLKENFVKLGNDLTMRVGKPAEVLTGLVEGLKQHQKTVSTVWMIAEEGSEEEQDEKSVAEACSTLGIDLKVWTDEKYFIDDRDLQLDSPQALPDVFTTYRKLNEPLRDRPRKTRPQPSDKSLPEAIEVSQIPSQPDPFEIPSSLEAFEAALLRPVEGALPVVPSVEEGKSAHPFKGGEDPALNRLVYLVKSGNASLYKTSRNGLLGVDYSTKLSAYLAQGCITARQIHQELLHFENGTDEKYSETDGFGQGENEGTKAIRFELLWRDYMRLCSRKFRAKLFCRSGFRNDRSHKWKTGRTEDGHADVLSQPDQEVNATLKRVFEGTTGQSLIDASSRELIHTGYTSNRARQNVGSFLAKHLNIDWRYGAEWYEFMLVDYDVNSNWANWQYVAGVGNDPRGEARIFNPVKQAFDYDKDGEYVRCWVPEVRKIEKLENLFQPWTTPREDWERFGLAGLPMAESPVKKIEFSVDGKPKSARRSFVRRRGQGRGGEAAAAGASSHGNGNGNAKPIPPQPQPQDFHVPKAQPPVPYRAYHTMDFTPNSRGGPHGGPRGGGFRGGGGGGGRGYGGGYRGRGYGGPRRGYQGGRGGRPQPHMQDRGALPLAQPQPSVGPGPA